MASELSSISLRSLLSCEMARKKRGSCQPSPGRCCIQQGTTQKHIPAKTRPNIIEHNRMIGERTVHTAQVYRRGTTVAKAKIELQTKLILHDQSRKRRSSSRNDYRRRGSGGGHSPRNRILAEETSGLLMASVCLHCPERVVKTIVPADPTITPVVCQATLGTDREEHGQKHEHEKAQR